MVAAGELLQAAAHALPCGTGGEHLLHQPVHLLLGEGHKAGGVGVAVLPVAHLGVIVVANAVGPAARGLCDLFKYGLQRQALLLCFIGGLPQELIFALAPPRPSSRFGNCMLHFPHPPKASLIKSMHFMFHKYTPRAYFKSFSQLPRTHSFCKNYPCCA